MNAPAASPSRAAAPPLPLEQYWQRVEETRDLVAGLRGAAPEAVQEQLLAEAAEWEEVTALLLPGGTQVPLDPTFLVSLLRADPPDLERLDGLLAALLAARDSWPPPKHSALDRAALERILSRPEFQWPQKQPSPLAQWWERLLEWLERLLGGRRSGGTVRGGLPLLRDLLTIVGAVALAAVLVYVVIRLRAGLVAEKEIGPEAEAIEDLTAATALKQAQRLAGERDYRAAVRYLYLSSLLLLEERGLLRYDRSRTNREYLSSVAESSHLAAVLAPVVDIFERVWYGYQPLDRASYTQYEEWVEDLQRQR